VVSKPPILGLFLVLKLELEQSATHSYLTRFWRKQVVTNPDTQIILDEIVRWFKEHGTKWDRCFANQEMS
jgi:hypothetical protein